MALDHEYGPNPEQLLASTLNAVQDEIIDLWAGKFDNWKVLLPAADIFQPGSAAAAIDNTSQHWGGSLAHWDLPVGFGDTIVNCKVLAFGAVTIRVETLNSAGASTLRGALTGGTAGQWAWLTIPVSYTLVAGDAAMVDADAKCAACLLEYSRT